MASGIPAQLTYPSCQNTFIAVILGHQSRFDTINSQQHTGRTISTLREESVLHPSLAQELLNQRRLEASRNLLYRACPPNQCSTWPPCSKSMSCSPMNAIMSGEVQYVSMSSTLHCVLRSHELALCRARAKPECPGCAWQSCHHTLHDRSRQTHPRRVLGLCNLPKYVAIWAPYFMYIRIDTYTCKDIFICLWKLTLNPKDILTYINA